MCVSHVLIVYILSCGELECFRMRGFLCDEQFAELPLVFKDLHFYSAMTDLLLTSALAVGRKHDLLIACHVRGQESSGGLGDTKASPVAAL